MNRHQSFDRLPGSYDAAERRALAAEYRGSFLPTRRSPVLDDPAEAVQVARQFAAEITETSADREIEPIPPLVELERASALGLTSLFVPRSHGGPEAGYWTLAQVIRTVAEANPSVAQILIAQYSLGDVITDQGTVAQKDHFLPLIVAGARIANALTEARTKSAADFTTRLSRRPEGGWRLDGEKFYTTGSYVAHFFPVLATDEDGAVVFALVARDAVGLTILDDWRGVGQRATVSGTARFDGVPVEDIAVIRPDGPSLPHSGNTFAQLLHAAVDVGIAEGALAAAADFLTQKARAWPEAGVERASQEPHTIRTFGELKVLALAADALVERAAGILDRLRRTPRDAGLQTEAVLAVAAARAAADHAALTVSNEIFALGGARASLEAWNLDRFWRNARTHTVHDPIRWRHHAIGDFHLNGAVPPDNARSARRGS
ncbi:acyl-CoA dehydrogenase family protein [Kaistia sp. MMO-174]|uniref:acyl-CoA dehydrogenase family protein n=1 Tax=Kaistia sp. MMO-174 TaxID=3081256 RepID=UPI0030162C91